MKSFVFIFCMFYFCSASGAEDRKFAADAVAFLDAEIPKMESAVVNNDRAYFGPALARVQVFFNGWQSGQGTDVLERYSDCSNAISSFLIVGLCKISPPGSICEPVTFFPKVEKNIEACRASATSANDVPVK